MRVFCFNKLGRVFQFCALTNQTGRSFFGSSCETLHCKHVFSLFTMPFFFESPHTLTHAAVALCPVCEISCVQDLPAQTRNITSSRARDNWRGSLWVETLAWSSIGHSCSVDAKNREKSAQCGISSSHAAWCGSSWRSRSDWWSSGEHGEWHRDRCLVLDQAVSDDWLSVTGVRSTTLVSENKEVDALDALLDLNVLEEDPLTSRRHRPFGLRTLSRACVCLPPTRLSRRNIPVLTC